MEWSLFKFQWRIGKKQISHSLHPLSSHFDRNVSNFLRNSILIYIYLMFFQLSLSVVFFFMLLLWLLYFVRAQTIVDSLEMTYRL